MPTVQQEPAALGAAFDYPSGFRIPRHSHERAQLVFASTGVMTVTAAGGAWVVPTQRAVWVPAGLEHEIAMTGAVAMRTLYVAAGALVDAPASCRVVHVTPLLRELILRIVAFERPYTAGATERRLIDVLLDEIGAAQDAPLSLPAARDDRLRAVTERLERDPADRRTLQAWSRVAGASARTLARLFVAETGMSFAAWRQQLRLIRALELLGEGRSVTEVALALGYDSPSAFIAMFRRSLGKTPARYFASE